MWELVRVEHRLYRTKIMVTKASESFDDAATGHESTIDKGVLSEVLPLAQQGAHPASHMDDRTDKRLAF